MDVASWGLGLEKDLDGVRCRGESKLEMQIWYYSP